MLPGAPSRTLLGSAIRRGQHQLLDSPIIFRDPVVLQLVPEAHDPDALPELGRHDDIVPKLHRALMALRARFAEDCLARAAERGARQYAIIGSGLDTFPWRQPVFAREMRIFAVDHPASLIWTHRRLRERGLIKPPNLIHVPADLECPGLADQLDACGFERTSVSFCSILGVIPYLSLKAVDSLLQFAATLAPESEIILSFITLEDELTGPDLDAVVRGSARTERLGEPWKFREKPADILDRLHGAGFRRSFHLTPEMAQERYFQNREDGLRAPFWEQMVAVTV
jgi:methyltransferase (TIGR00027 family)